MAFLHGVETIVVQKGAVNIQTARSSVIGLVGFAPKGAVNTLTLISSANEAADTFGKEVPGFTIPQALSAIYAQGGAQVLVVNVFDDANNIDTATDEENTVVAGKVVLPAAPIDGTLVVKNSGGATTYVEGTHYSVDEFGVITIIDGTTIVNGATLECTYNFLDTSTFTASQVIGTAGSTPTGIKIFEVAKALFGFSPKILIAPKLLGLTGVPTELIAQAEALKAITILDAPTGTTVTQAITARGSAGTIEGWKSSSYATILAFPNVLAYDVASNGTQERPASQYLAGVIAAKDVSNGYWWSPSNTEILGITGTAIPITSGISDPSSQANQLNAAGVVTVFNAFGSGFRTWGNRSAAFPANTDPKQFISVYRTASILHESVEFAMLQFLDRPLNQALIDAIRDSVNAFIRTLVGRGALIDGNCIFDPVKNPATELAAGHLVFDIDFMPPVPAERITFESYINIEYLNSLV